MVVTWRTPDLRADYLAFHRAAIATGDIDPSYPVLGVIGRRLNLAAEQRVWLTFLHVAYYHLGSALRALDVAGADPNPLTPVLTDKAKTGTERRAHRVPGRLAVHTRSLADIAWAHGGLEAWLWQGLDPGRPEAGWRRTVDRLTLVDGNGRWAAYKTAEILWKVNGLPIRAPDMGHAHSSGPRHGLDLLMGGLPRGNRPSDVKALDQASARLCAWLAARNAPHQVEEVETTLCDFHALHAGRYYTGHDVDQMLEHLNAVPSGYSQVAFAARTEVFPPALLGEVNGWTGVRKNLNRAYVDSGRPVWWEAA